MRKKGTKVHIQHSIWSFANLWPRHSQNHSHASRRRLLFYESLRLTNSPSCKVAMTKNWIFFLFPHIIIKIKPFSSAWLCSSVGKACVLINTQTHPMPLSDPVRFPVASPFSNDHSWLGGNRVSTGNGRKNCTGAEIPYTDLLQLTVSWVRTVASSIGQVGR